MENSKQVGNKFQDDFASSIPQELYYSRLKDMPSQKFKKVHNEGDYTVFSGKFMLVVECKTTKDTNLPLANIQMNQIWKMILAVTKLNTFGGLIVEFRKYDICYFVPIDDFIRWYLYERNNRSNLPLTWIKENGYKVAMKKKISRFRYGVKGLLDWVEVNFYDEGI